MLSEHLVLPVKRKMKKANTLLRVLQNHDERHNSLTISSAGSCHIIASLSVLLQSLVFSHLHYSSVLLSGINQKLIPSLDKQINWALKTITYRKNMNHREI